MMELLTDPNAWASLLTLTVLEIVLGIDNIIFLSVVTATLPKHQQPLARKIGLALALIMRIVMLCTIAWIMSLQKPIIEIGEYAISWRDIILILGGLFLLVKGTREIHAEVDGDHDETKVRKASFFSVIVQIVILDLVFSLDSVITAVGMAEHIEIMIAAVIIAIIVMMVAAEPVSNFVHTHPSVKMLALSFILLVGMALVADGMHFHIPRGYLYFAIAFSLGVETMNLLAAKARKKRRELEKQK